MSALGPDMPDIALLHFDAGVTVQRCVGQPRARAIAASASLDGYARMRVSHQIQHRQIRYTVTVGVRSCKVDPVDLREPLDPPGLVGHSVRVGEVGCRKGRGVVLTVHGQPFYDG